MCEVKHADSMVVRRLPLLAVATLLAASLIVALPGPGKLDAALAAARPDAALAAARPDANIAAGARKLPGPFNAADPSTCDRWVSMNGKDSNPGTQSQPWKTVTKAVTTLGTPGQGRVGCVNQGTYDELGAVAM